MKTVKQKNALRNPLHDHPLMKRGGVHEKTKKAQRQQDKHQLKKLWRYLKVNMGLFLNNVAGLKQGIGSHENDGR